MQQNIIYLQARVCLLHGVPRIRDILLLQAFMQEHPWCGKFPEEMGGMHVKLPEPKLDLSVTLGCTEQADLLRTVMAQVSNPRLRWIILNFNAREPGAAAEHVHACWAAINWVWTHRREESIQFLQENMKLCDDPDIDAPVAQAHLASYETALAGGGLEAWLEGLYEADLQLKWVKPK